jgi:hypothetical protein
MRKSDDLDPIFVQKRISNPAPYAFCGEELRQAKQMKSILSGVGPGLPFRVPSVMGEGRSNGHHLHLGEAAYRVRVDDHGVVGAQSGAALEVGHRI